VLCLLFATITISNAQVPQSPEVDQAALDAKQDAENDAILKEAKILVQKNDSKGAVKLLLSRIVYGKRITAEMTLLFMKITEKKYRFNCSTLVNLYLNGKTEKDRLIGLEEIRKISPVFASIVDEDAKSEVYRKKYPNYVKECNTRSHLRNNLQLIAATFDFNRDMDNMSANNRPDMK
jgi:hypothetical protein